MLTFDEFLDIPPCTTGTHSSVDDTPAPEPKPVPADLAPVSDAPAPAAPRAAQAVPNPSTASSSPAPEVEDSDDEGVTVPPGATCKRKGCGAQAPKTQPASREGESCVYHPGQALFHEGSKGWTCCKRRVLEFDEFMKIAGCKTRSRHCFVGKKGARRKEGELERVETVRHDFYQTPGQVHASLYLKKVDKATSKVEFRSDGTAVDVDLRTADGKQYQTAVPLYGKVNPETSRFAIKTTKVDLTLEKADGLSWPVLRSDEKLTGEIIQTGKAGRA